MIALHVLATDDWVLWRRLRLAALGDAPYAFGSRLADWQGAGDREQRWRDRLALPGSLNLVATLAGEPAGMVSGVPTAPERDEVEVISLWVSPLARGRGVGDALLAAVVDWARDIGAASVRLSVADGNSAAARLYRRHGFVAAPELDQPMPDGIRAERGMRLQLR